MSELLLPIGTPSVGRRILRSRARQHELLRLPLPGDSDPSSCVTATSHTRKTTLGSRKKQKNARAQEGFQSERNVRAQGRNHRRASTIDMLPDEVLLEIFDIYRNPAYPGVVWKWHLLAHVCQSWRRIILESPHRLDLQIRCTNKTRVKKNLGIWPDLPILTDYCYYGRSIRPRGEGNVIAALRHPSRVCHVQLNITDLQLGKMATVMKEPFPVLKHLEICSKGGNAPVLPAKFLGGSAPRLQKVTLSGIPYPTLPTLLLSASGLVTLRLHDIPPTGYLSPEALVVVLAALPRLATLDIGFRSATSRPDRLPPPPVTRTVLPALTYFDFKGASEYLEDLIARIDSPQLHRIETYYLNQLVDFQVDQLSKFIHRSVSLKSALCRCADVLFHSRRVSFVVYLSNKSPWKWLPARTVISCEGIDWQVSHMAQVLSQVSETISSVIHLGLKDLITDHQLEGGTDDAEWLHLLRQFPTVQTLRVSQLLAGHVALALEDITAEMVAEVLPSLDLIYLEGRPASSIEKFVAARRLSGRPVTVINTRVEFDKRLESYVRK